MPNEELYRSLYSKYAPELLGKELEDKINYALTLDSTEFVKSFYQKYTGADPSPDQMNYINTIIVAITIHASVASMATGTA